MKNRLIKAETRPVTLTVPALGFAMPATAERRALPGPLRPMTPTVEPFATLNETPFSATNASFGRSRSKPAQQRA